MWIYILIAVLLIFISVILIRTAAFKPQKQEPLTAEKIIFDNERAVECLKTLVQFKTVSDLDSKKEDDEEFERLINKLPELYPNVYKECTLTRFDGRGLLYKWKGKTDGKPSVFMAHYDVVSVEEKNWEKPPFDGIIEDGYLWGRGTLDTKATFNGALFAVDHLIKEGFIPTSDVYLAFSGGEEVNGVGAINIKNYFKENNIELEMVLDEGGAVVNNVFPGVKEPCALVGVGEKGMLNLKYSVKSSGGHASAPKPESPLPVLSKAIIKLDKNPFKAKTCAPVSEMFDKVGRKSTFVYRMIFANLWLFGGLLGLIAKKSGGDMNALFRTTVAFTQAEGSKGINVIPPIASVYSNSRITPNESVNEVIETIRKTIDDDRVELEVITATEPSRISRTDTEGYKRVEMAIAKTWNGVLVSPYLMLQCSDCRHYGDISDKVYRFSAMALTNEERATIHGNNEKIRIDEISKTVEFYIRIIKSC